MSNRWIRPGAYALLTWQDRIVLVRCGQGPFQGNWVLPGGGIEFGETPEEALTRELDEETGLTRLPAPRLIGALSDRAWHPEETDTEMHLLGYLYHVALDAQRPIKQDADGQDSLGAKWFQRQDLSDLKIGSFARQGINLWPEEGATV